MTPPDQPVLTRRERERRRRGRHRHLRRIGAVVGSLAVAVVAVLYATDTLRFGGSGPSLAEGSEAARAPTGDADPLLRAQLDQLDESRPPRPLTHEDPLRLYVAGDSHVGIVGRELGKKVEVTGVVEAQVDFKVSSGIANHAIRDWPGQAAQQLADHDPEAVVFMVGTNDTLIVGSHDGDGDGVPDWEPDYRAKVAEMMDLLVGDAQRMVLWVGVPPLRRESLDAGAHELNRVMREEADRRPSVVFFDTYPLFEGPDGGWSSTIEIDGEAVRVRNGDGIHFTEAGGQYLADHLLRVLDAHWKISEFADPANPIAFGVEAGSACGSACSGYSGGSSSGSSNGGSADTTTAPETTTTADPGTTSTTAVSTTTAPPTTLPPTTLAPTTLPSSTTTPPTTASSGGPADVTPPAA